MKLNTNQDPLVAQLAILTEEVKDLRQALETKKEFYTNKEFMDLFHVSTATVKKWRDSGLLGYSQTGDTYIYRKVDIENFLLATHHKPIGLKKISTFHG